jgi:hypothetical protein
MNASDDLLMNDLRGTRALVGIVCGSVGARSLVVAVEKLERVIRNWGTLRPTDAQRDAMAECVKELRAKAVSLIEAVPTQKLLPATRANASLRPQRRVSQSIARVGTRRAS